MQKFFRFTYNLTREATLCQTFWTQFENSLDSLSFVASTKRSKHKQVKTLFHNLGEFVFEFNDSRIILATFEKVFFSNRFSQHDRSATPVPNASFSARTRCPPSPIRFYDRTMIIIRNIHLSIARQRKDTIWKEPFLVRSGWWWFGSICTANFPGWLSWGGRGGPAGLWHLTCK